MGTHIYPDTWGSGKTTDFTSPNNLLPMLGLDLKQDAAGNIVNSLGQTIAKRTDPNFSDYASGKAKPDVTDNPALKQLFPDDNQRKAVIDGINASSAADINTWKAGGGVPDALTSTVTAVAQKYPVTSAKEPTNFIKFMRTAVPAAVYAGFIAGAGTDTGNTNPETNSTDAANHVLNPDGTTTSTVPGGSVTPPVTPSTGGGVSTGNKPGISPATTTGGSTGNNPGISPAAITGAVVGAKTKDVQPASTDPYKLMTDEQKAILKKTSDYVLNGQQNYNQGLGFYKSKMNPDQAAAASLNIDQMFPQQKSTSGSYSSLGLNPQPAVTPSTAAQPLATPSQKAAQPTTSNQYGMNAQGQYDTRIPKGYFEDANHNLLEWPTIPAQTAALKAAGAPVPTPQSVSGQPPAVTNAQPTAAEDQTALKDKLTQGPANAQAGGQNAPALTDDNGTANKNNPNQKSASQTEIDQADNQKAAVNSVNQNIAAYDIPVSSDEQSTINAYRDIGNNPIDPAYQNLAQRTIDTMNAGLTPLEQQALAQEQTDLTKYAAGGEGQAMADKLYANNEATAKRQQDAALKQIYDNMAARGVINSGMTNLSEQQSLRDYNDRMSQERNTADVWGNQTDYDRLMAAESNAFKGSGYARDVENSNLQNVSNSLGTLTNLQDRGASYLAKAADYGYKRATDKLNNQIAAQQQVQSGQQQNLVNQQAVFSGQMPIAQMGATAANQATQIAAQQQQQQNEALSSIFSSIGQSLGGSKSTPTYSTNLGGSTAATTPTPTADNSYYTGADDNGMNGDTGGDPELDASGAPKAKKAVRLGA